MVHYLGRYTHRVAISNHRLVSFSEGQITFRWRDSAHHNEQKLLTLSSDEFLRRFLLHILPKGFVRIRNFGFLANRKRTKLLPLCFHLFGATPQPQVASHPSGTKNSSQSWRCPECGGPMKVIKRFTAGELQLRSPPKVTAAVDLSLPVKFVPLLALPEEPITRIWLRSCLSLRKVGQGIGWCS